MSFEIKPKVINANDVVGLSAQISAIQTGNANVVSTLETKGAVVPDTYKQYTVGIHRDIFIAGGGNTGAYSYDAITWIQNVNFPTDITQPVYLKDKFFIFSWGAGVFYSYDGITWTNSQYIGYGRWDKSPMYADGKFVIIRGNGQPYFSYNGINWVEGTLGEYTPSGYEYYTPVYGNGKFVTINSAGNAAYSIDGINWTGVYDIGAGGYFYAKPVYGNGKFVAINYYGVVMYTEDGISWIQPTTSLGPNNFVTTPIYASGMFVVLGDGGAYFSTDAINWTQASLPMLRLTDLIFANDSWYYVSYNGSIMKSSSLTTWTAVGQIGFPYGWQIFDTFYHTGKKFVLRAYYQQYKSRIYSSLDGVNWDDTMNAIPEYSYSPIFGIARQTKTIAEILGV